MSARLSAYVEIISYTRLLQDAKKRKRILFDKLHRQSSIRDIPPARNTSIGRSSDGAERNVFAQLSVTAQNVCKFHVMRRAAVRREEARTADNDASAMSARGCNVEAIKIVEELHASRRIL